MCSVEVLATLRDDKRTSLAVSQEATRVIKTIQGRLQGADVGLFTLTRGGDDVGALSVAGSPGQLSLEPSSDLDDSWRLSAPRPDPRFLHG